MRIKFSHYYQKLNDRLYTTVRPWNANRENYYRQAIGKSFDVIANMEDLGEAKLLYVHNVNFAKLPKAFLDYDTEEIWQLPGEGRGILLLFLKEEKEVIII